MTSKASIRFTLALYCTTLLALTTATVSILGYRTSYANLESRRTVTRQLFDAQFNDRSRELEEHMDNELLSQAQTLATLMHLQANMPRIHYHPLTVLGLLGNAQNTQFALPIWIGEIRGPIHFQILKSIGPIIRLDPDRVQVQGNLALAEFFQIYMGFWNSTSISKSLNGVPMDRNLKNFAPDRALYWEFDETRLPDGRRVRRVRLKTSSHGFMFFGNFRGPPRPENRSNSANQGRNSNDRDRGGQNPNGASSVQGSQPLALFIECAYDHARFEKRVEALRAKRDADIADHDDETDADLAALKRELALVGSLSFIAATVGLWGLVRRGLSPLHRLSDAVSKINPANINLEIEVNRLPSELRPIASRIKETLEQLSRAFAREKQATADISHELRTPLATLLTTCDLSLRKSRSVEEYREFLGDCKAAGLQMNRAVDRLLTLARLDAGADAVRKSEIDLNNLVRSCIKQVDNLAESAHIRIYHELSPVPSLVVDADKLSEVVLNLLHNGIQYNRPGGSVTLRTRQREDHAEISVIDTGIGIKSEDREMIFERFFRVDPSRTSDGMNSGLGLSIVKGFVELMGGAIQVESTVGSGSTFRLLLPLQKAKPQNKIWAT